MDKLKATSRSLETPDDALDKGRGHIEVVDLGGLKVKRQTFQPGWRFSTDMAQPVCYDTHVGYSLSGHMHVRLQDGTEIDVHAGDAFVIPPGHDAWIVGDEAVTMIQFDEGASALERFGVEAVSEQAA